MIFVATTFNLMFAVRVAVQFTVGTWVTIREHFDTKVEGGLINGFGKMALRDRKINSIR